jgi:hypothetical protein
MNSTIASTLISSEPVSVMDAPELDDLPEELELNMERELMQIKLKYESKRAPILKALIKKRQSTSVINDP